MAMIFNIIEDAYIEAVGCSYYDNLDMYLKFGRVTRLVASKQSEGSVSKVFNKKGVEASKQLPLLVEYLEYMIIFLLYPMAKQEEAKPCIAPFVADTKQLFLDGSAAPSPDARYAFCTRIFDRIVSLIPDDDKELDFAPINVHLGGCNTHSPKATTLTTSPHKGKTQAVTQRLFTRLDGKPRENAAPIAQLSELLSAYAAEKEAALAIVTDKGHRSAFTGKDFDCAVLHRDIKINVIRPRINLNLKKAYENIYKKYNININSYNSRFLSLLQAQVPVQENGFLFGSGISSARLGDAKKRYWYRRIPGIDIPDLAVLLLIDGSGSMQGSRRESTMVSAIILHEVLKKQGIPHAIAEHRANFNIPEIDINILLDFAAREEEKLNLMRINAYGNNRDGLALYWAERYINQKSHCENKLIIVISDGLPNHHVDNYIPPISVDDTANAATKIANRGTNIIAVALDDSDSLACYDEIRDIYPHVVACNDLKRLTAQLLTLVSKQLQ